MKVSTKGRTNRLEEKVQRYSRKGKRERNLGRKDGKGRCEGKAGRGDEKREEKKLSVFVEISECMVLSVYVSICQVERMEHS